MPSRDPYLTYISAKGVAALWIAAAVIPVFLVPQSSGRITLRNVIAGAVLIVAVALVSRDLKRLRLRGAVALSDKLACVFVPATIFVAVLGLVVLTTYA